MAYLSAGEWSDLFDRLGKIVLASRAVDHAWSADIEADNLDGIYAQTSRYVEVLVETQDEEIVEDAVALRTAMATSLAGFNSSLVTLVESVLNRGLIDQGGDGSFKSIFELMTLLRWYMGNDGYAVKAQDVTVTGYDGPHAADSVSSAQEVVHARPANTGDGDAFTNYSDAADQPPAIFVSIRGILKAMDDDAVNVIPTQCWNTDIDTDAEEQQGAYADSYEVKVLTDKFSGGSSGSEALSLHGTRPPDEGVYSGDYQHVGDRNTLTMVSSANGNALTNGGFDTYTGGGAAPSFSGWTLDTGVTGTNLFAAIAGMARGLACADFRQTAGVNPQLSQAVTLTAKQKYLVSFLYKVTAVGAAGALLNVKLIGTGWTPTGITKAIDATTATWQRGYFWVNAPEDVPDDAELRIYTTGTVSATYATVLLDEIVVHQCVAQPDGLFVIPVAGTDDYDPILGDHWFFSVANSRASLFQAFFTRFFSTILPATAVTGTGYIADPVPA